MEKSCKHPIKRLSVVSYSWTDHHPYGEDTYTGYRLKCLACGKERDINHQNDTPSVVDYTKLTDRTLDLAEAKKLFKENNKLFHELQDIHPEIVNLVISNPKLEAKIYIKRKLIEKHKKELAALIKKYNGGKEPFLS